MRSYIYIDRYSHLYDWLQSMFSFLAVLSDFEDAYNHLDDKGVMREITLVADSLRLGGAILGKFNISAHITYVDAIDFNTFNK